MSGKPRVTRNLIVEAMQRTIEKLPTSAQLLSQGL
jgi:hypothetical protein